MLPVATGPGNDGGVIYHRCSRRKQSIGSYCRMPAVSPIYSIRVAPFLAVVLLLASISSTCRPSEAVHRTIFFVYQAALADAIYDR